MKNKLLFCISLLSLSFFSITSSAVPRMNNEEQEDNQQEFNQEEGYVPMQSAYPNLNSSFCFYFPNAPECLVGGAYYVEPYSFYNNYRPYGFWYGRDYGYGRYGRDYGYGYGRHRDWRGSRDKHHGMNRGDNDRRSNFSDRMNRNDNIKKIDRTGFKNRSKSFGKRR